MKRKIALLLTLLLIVGILPACSKEETPEEPNDELVIENKEEEKKEEEIPANQNLLTGLGDLSEEAIGKRPVAVMVNNIMAAMPQYGVEQADIIFEIPVEGTHTRMMALYADYTAVPKICAIRSCRYYFPVFSEGFDAFYVNWGMDETMRAYVESLTIDQIDGMYNPGGMFGRDQARLNSGYALEHTGYFDGTMIASYVQSQGKRLELEADKTGPAFVFNGMNEQVKPEGDACTKVNVDFGGHTGTLTYDESSKTYKKDNCGEPQIDGKTGNQLGFTNVFILETSITVRDNEGRKAVDWEGGKDAVGYYVSNGAVQKINWSKDSEDGRLRFFDENGEELSINRGKSYIAVNYANQTTFE